MRPDKCMLIYPKQRAEHEWGTGLLYTRSFLHTALIFNSKLTLFEVGEVNFDTSVSELY